MINRQLVSGGLASRLNQAYGLLVVRVRTDLDPSAVTSGAVLTWPESGLFPRDGENDLYETLTIGKRSQIWSFVHYGTRPHEQYWFERQANASRWHTVAMAWTPAAITFYLDGVPTGQVTSRTRIPHVPHHLCLQLDAFRNTIRGRVRMQVDYVRIYALNRS